MNLLMVASTCSMSSTMCARAASSATLSSTSSRSRASGVRRSCEMPASISTRSCSAWPSWRVMRLKSMLTSRISCVATFSSSRTEPNFPSRTCAAAACSFLSGWLTSRASSAAPSSESAAAMPNQTSQVLRSTAPTRLGSVSSQNCSRPILKPTHSPSRPLTWRATSVPLPSSCVSSALILRPKAFWS